MGIRKVGDLTVVVGYEMMFLRADTSERSNTCFACEYITAVPVHSTRPTNCTDWTTCFAVLSPLCY